MQDRPREAMLFTPLGDKSVRCDLCARRCRIQVGKTGFCRVRKNLDGTLYSLNYAKAVAANADPMEKKPLYHFLPRRTTYSIATVGCNLACSYCLNWSISQEEEIVGRNLPPERVVQEALSLGCSAVSYTYTEPTIFFEWAFDTSRLAHGRGLKNTFVTNGYMTPEAVGAIAPHLDAATVDFKGNANAEFYRKFAQAPSVDPIFESLKEMKAKKIHLEVTDLVVPKYGDSLDDARKLAAWIVDNLGPETPFHVLRFHPDYKLLDLPSTPIEAIERTLRVAKEEGLRYVYGGNVPGHSAENTYCPHCGELLIERWGFSVVKWNVTEGKTCPECGARIPIVDK
ncbi:MAG: AmmeMemoRadiSam system radical SAM enzyme [Candidatus Brockarchaeota archaeon]|nr:AmmeMemoRadiSam system radical SAM enzyme [Candidatus Brockarchaeota archaeon]